MHPAKMALPKGFEQTPAPAFSHREDAGAGAVQPAETPDDQVLSAEETAAA